MRGDDEHQTAHTPIALMLCSKLENLATLPRRAQAQHKCEDNIIDRRASPLEPEGLAHDEGDGFCFGLTNLLGGLEGPLAAMQGVRELMLSTTGTLMRPSQKGFQRTLAAGSKPLAGDEGSGLVVESCLKHERMICVSKRLLPSSCLSQSASASARPRNSLISPRRPPLHGMSIP